MDWILFEVRPLDHAVICVRVALPSATHLDGALADVDESDVVDQQVLRSELAFDVEAVETKLFDGEIRNRDVVSDDPDGVGRPGRSP